MSLCSPKVARICIHQSLVACENSFWNQFYHLSESEGSTREEGFWKPFYSEQKNSFARSRRSQLSLLTFAFTAPRTVPVPKKYKCITMQCPNTWSKSKIWSCLNGRRNRFCFRRNPRAALFYLFTERTENSWSGKNVRVRRDYLLENGSINLDAIFLTTPICLKEATKITIFTV